MAEAMLLSAFLQVMFERLTPRVGDLWKLAFREGLEKKLEAFVKLFGKIEDVLADAEEKQLTKRDVKIWLDDLKDLAYDAEDVLDEFSTEALRREVMAKQQTTTSKCLNLMPALKFKIKMGSKIDSIMSRLEDISKRKTQLSLVVSVGGASSTNTWQPTPTTPELIEPVVYGREKEKKEIIDLLLTDDQNCHVIPIVAMGGAGKTTLAQHVYKDQGVAQAFKTKAWVCVSTDSNVTRLMKEILLRTTEQHRELNDYQSIEAKLKEALGGQRFLIVLDDIWEHTFVYDDWIVLKSLFRVGARGSKIIVTTRQEEVAKQMGIVQPYKLELLSGDDCWDLFQTHAFKERRDDFHPNLELIRKKIVERCNGLPLAARALGGLLCIEPSHRWDKILNNKILSVPQERGGVLNVLRLSYYYLPSHLKKCFVYCAIFPQNYEFTEEELVLLWIAEGLIQQKERREDELIQEGHAYFRGLVSRSLFQASNDDGSKYTMHDLVHDLAKEVGGELYFLLNDVLESPKEIGQARHFSYITRKYDISKRFEIFLKTKHLRTFLPFQMMRGNDQYVSCSVLNLTFRLKKLRVLSIHGYQITELSDSIGNLKHLRYLDLSSTQIRCLPETTCSLHNLLILSLRNCKKLRALPSKMGNLINLFYLDIANTYRLKEMPIGLKELKSLQILSNFIVGKSNGCGLKELMNFKDLSEKLHISSLDNVVDTREAKEASLDKKNNLKVLVLKWSSNFNDSRDLEIEKSVLQLLQPNQNIEELTIISYGGNAFSTWLGDPLFSSMNVLKLENCKLCTCLPPLGQLPSLKTLQIRGMYGVKSVGAEFYGSPHSKAFPSLESLSFEDMSEWENWSGFDVNEQAEGFSCLSVLSISFCHKLSGNLPNHLPSLKKLVVSRCENLNVVISNFPKLYEVNINGCLELISRSMTSTIESLKMMHCPVPGRFPTTFCSLTCLRKLRISGCSSLVSLPSNVFLLPLLEVVDLNDLPNLRIAIDEVNDSSVTLGSWLTTANKELEIKHCPSLVCISTRGGLPASLTHLVISSCPRLEFVTETFLENGKLESIKIIGCETFQRLAEGMRSLGHLKYIEIKKCPNFLSFPQGGMTCNKLKSLEIMECKSLEALPDGISNITSLTRLDINNCERLAEMVLPISLTFLSIIACRKLISLRSLPIHLVELNVSDCGEMTSISNIPIFLTKLSILKCRKLTTLPYNLSTSSLTKLKIWFCDEMTSIPNIPISLTELSIGHCPKLILLPNLPNNLIQLRISLCEEMTSIPNIPTSLVQLFITKCRKICDCGKLTILPNNLSTSSLIELNISDCERMTSIPNIPISLTKLSIFRCSRLTTLPNNLSTSSLIILEISFDGEVTTIPNIPISLTQLNILECSKLTNLPNNLSTSSLITLVISNCERMKYLPDLPISLIKLHITDCENLENMKSPSSSSSNSIRNLTSLHELEIWSCPKLKSLPKEGLPPSLSQLEIVECPMLSKRCRRDKGKDWNKISSIPKVMIDGKLIYDPDSESDMSFWGRKATSN